MTPIPQEHASEDARAQDGEQVVISGMSGVYPQSNHVKDLEDILYSKKNPVIAEDCRWNYNHPEAAYYTGKVPNLDRFDAQFFKVHFRLGHSMDSIGRKILEQAYQSIYDAGVCPQYLNGKKVGVFIGCCFSEAEKACFYVASSMTGFGIAGCSKTMFANRISYWLNLKGPSMAIDEACCSSLAALEQAYRAMTRGECEAAIVGGGNLCLHPQSSVHYGRMTTLCMDGKTKSFDKNADGCAKSEAINVLFLQKAKDAKRVYAEVVNVKSEFNEILEGESGPMFGFYRDPNRMTDFLEHFYRESQVSPNSVEYVEAFGSDFVQILLCVAVPEADKAELEAIERVFCKERDDPLLVGSVMSNIGYGEAASGISAITKVLLGYNRGELASNLHYSTPRNDVAALREGRIQIVNDHMRFKRTYTAVNGFSATGINAHVLLNGHFRPKDLNRYKSSIPHLVTLTGRQESAVTKILEYLKAHPVDPEELALFHNIHKTSISGHLGRGYTILDSKGQDSVCLSETTRYFDDVKRPLWFVYSGMGSQWVGMGAQLMKIPVFAAAIEKCRKVLEPKGFNIVHIITSPEKTIYDNILYSFVGIAAIQIGLTDVLFSLGLVPDNMIGHSVGELGCAYADGCFTAEEMILAACSRGYISKETPFIKGSMAAVGIGYEQISKLVPPEIEVACHNSYASSTISGPADIMREFVTKLTEKGIFAKEIPCSNIAYHSRYIAAAGPGLLKYLRELIKTPKARSERWLSTSIPQDKWNEPLAKYSSAEYHTNNLLSPVLFEETSKLIPANAVLVEVAPHSLLQAILKRSLPDTCRYIPLTRRGHPDNAIMVLDGIGKLFMEGYSPKVENLYPKIEFPVSLGTPILSHLIEWAHQEKWNLPLYVSAHRKTAASCKFAVSTHDDENSYLRGHIFRGKNLYPFSAALVAAWDTLAMSLNVPKKQLSVEFRDIHLFAQPPLHDYRELRLSVALHRGTGRFEILDDNRKVANGFIDSEPQEIENSFTLLFERNDQMNLTSDDIYRLLGERDYAYRGEFRSILKANESLTEAQIIWNGNWVTFLDGLLQFTTLNEVHNSVSQPYQIRRLCIDTEKHKKDKAIKVDGKTIKVANVIKIQDTFRCGGALLQNVKFRKLPVLVDESVGLKTLQLIPRFHATFDVGTALQIFLQIVAENINKQTVNALHLMGTGKFSAGFYKVKKILKDVPGISVNYKKIKSEEALISGQNFLSEMDFVLVHNLDTDDNLYQTLFRNLHRDTFVINNEHSKNSKRQSALYRVVSSLRVDEGNLELIKWRSVQATASTVVTVKNIIDLDLLTETRQNMQQKHNLVILSSYPTVPGLKELVKQWRNESDRTEIFLVMISEKDNLEQFPEFHLAYNVLVDGIWGSEYYTPFKKQVIAQRYSLRTSKIGDINALHWIEAPKAYSPGVQVKVHYAAINDADVKKATGVNQLKDSEKPEETGFCMDLSGITISGQRVMGIVQNGAASSQVFVRSELLWPVPDHWSLEDAATVPSAYAHAFYCFAIKMQLKAGMRVLVHGGTGALGQAAISIAFAYGCDVFTTVGDVKKKRFLMKLFPELKRDHIGNSRDTTFGEMVLNFTNGKGCDVVISCMKGELKNVSLKICGNFGITMDTVQIPSHENYNFGMFNLTNERSYISVDLTSIFTTDNVNEMKKIQTLISSGIAQGYVRPLSRLVYPLHDVTKAFRLVDGSQHRGRVLLKLHDSIESAQLRLFCSPGLCHLVLSDNEALSIQLAERLITRGATNICLHGVEPSSYIQFKAKLWKTFGVKVKISSGDLTDNNGTINLINESNKLGPIEGIYVIATEVTREKSAGLSIVMANLDFAARKICQSIRYFAIVTIGSEIGQQTFHLRVQNNLPVTVLNLSHLNNDESGLTWRSAVKAMELAIRSSQSNVLAYTKKTDDDSLLKEIAKLAELNINEDTPTTLKLKDLGLDMAKVSGIESYLRNVHNIALLEKDIPILTVEKIRDLEFTINGSKFKKVQGLSTFFSFIDPDELLATADMIFLQTLTSSATMREDEFDMNKSYLCAIPGMGGHHNKFQILCKRIKLPALVLQPGLDHLQETLRETAERYAKVLLKKTNLKNNFYLLGYETGVMVALEIASIMEDYGVIGTVYCIGGTPEEITAAVEKQISECKNKEELQNSIICHMFALMTGNTEGLDQCIQNAADWKTKVEACVRLLLGQVHHSAQYARALMEAAYTRIVQARVYRPQSKPLRWKIIWMHASGMSDVTPTKQMQQYSHQPVIVHELEAPLAHATLDLQCSAIINRYLEPELLQAFEVKNLCETYLLNKDFFMTNAAEVCGDIA